MVAEDTQNSRFSKFSLAVAKDSGWFEVDLSLGEHFTWGKGAGCEFVQKRTCFDTNSYEICSENRFMTCSRDFKTKYSCSKTGFTDECRIGTEGINCVDDREGSFYENFGVNSRCHFVETYDQIYSGCVEVECSADLASYYIKIMQGEKQIKFKCTEKFDKINIPGYSINFICKDPKEYCSLNNLCEISCGKR
jgi:hypothetical protein